MKYKQAFFLVLVILSLMTISCTSTNDELLNEQLSDDSFSKVQERGKLIVGTNIPYEPMEFLDENGEFAGIDVDVAREIALRLNLEIEFVNYGWDELFVAVKAGEVDFAISSITITDERSQEMLFSIPYFNAGQVIVVSAEDESVLTPEDLLGKKVGVQMDTTSYDEAVKYAGESLVLSYEDYDLATVALLNDNLSAIIIDYIAGLELVKNNPSLKVVGTPFTQEFYGLASMKENNLLMNEVNQVLGTMIWGKQIEEITNKWI
jgi:ABC-type amino acid transport substrate-binding protein